MDLFLLLGRILYGGVLLVMATNHFAHIKPMTDYAQSKGVPMPKLAVLGSGVVLTLGSLSILLGSQTGWGVLLLVVFFVPVTLRMHNFWTVTDDNAKMMEMTQFLKNMALLGAALMFLAIPGPWPYSLG
ncbi:MAG: DoxX family protein [Deltaproteobacteria bacterium]|nr:DoxX family protein [Deltaproteobacteria bacterium]